MNGSEQMILARFDLNGDLLEYSAFGGNRREAGFSISGDEPSGFLLTGRSNSFSENTWDTYLVKIDSAFDTTWTQTITNGGFLSGEMSVEQSNNSHTVMCRSGIGTSWGLELVNINEIGSTQWRTVYPIGTEWFAYGAVCQDESQNYVLAGTSWPNELVIHKVAGGSQSIDTRKQSPESHLFSVDVYPNPFNSTVSIPLELAKAEMVDVRIYNVLGQEVYSFGRRLMLPGRQELLWEGVNGSGVGLASGVYVVQARTVEEVASVKVELVR
jgi:hypothetical protein